MAISSLWSRFGAAFVGLLSGGAASRAVRPIFELVEQESWDANPNRVLPLQTLAELVATALVDDGPAAGEAQRSGWTPNRLAALVQLALRAPTIGEARDMRRRDAITNEQFVHALRKAGLEPQYDQAALELLEVLPTVTDMVRFGVREVYNPALRAELDLDAEFPEPFAADAKRLGLSRKTAGDYWAAHWELPSYTQLTEMLFRGELTQGEYQNALKAIDYAPTWRSKLEAIARRIPTIPDMVRFAVREVYNPPLRQKLGYEDEYPEAFTAQAALHGMSEEHAKQYWWAHWRLPSARQGYTMLWRDEIDAGELDELLKALDYPKVWRSRLANIARLVPGRIDLKRMLRFEIIDRDEVKAGYRRLGYAELDAERMTQIAEAEVGTGEEAGAYVAKARTSLWNRLHTEFVSRQLTAAEVDAGLEAVGVPAAQRETVKTLWAYEALTVKTELTQAQIVKAYKKGLLEQPEAIAELVERGMSEGDAAIRLQSG